MQKVEIALTGATRVLMHNARLSDPLDPLAQAVKTISGKRKKTEADHEAMAKAEFAGGLYFDPDIGPYLPADNLLACLVDAGRTKRLGKIVQTAVIPDVDRIPLDYHGPREPDAMYSDANTVLRTSVVIKGVRVMRTRPQIPAGWKATTVLTLDPDQLDLADLATIVEIAGTKIGLGDWRPRYGRFNAIVTGV